MGPAMDPDNWENGKQARMDYWRRIKNVRDDFDGTIEEFYQFLENTHGLKLSLDANGNITEFFKIVDEQKYLLFMLKYTQ